MLILSVRDDISQIFFVEIFSDIQSADNTCWKL